MDRRETNRENCEDSDHVNTAEILHMKETEFPKDYMPSEDEPYMNEVMRLSMESVSLLLSPIVPHFSEELWQAMGYRESVLLTPWPSYREDALVKDELVIVVQINGKLRSTFRVDADADETTIKELALSDERIQKFIKDKPIQRIIVVKKKLVNIVI